MSLTPRQREVFEFIQAFIHKHGHSPSHQDLMKAFDWKSPGTVQDLLNALSRRGYLSRSNRTAHTLKITEFDEVTHKLQLLGKVAAGRPLEHFKHNERIEVPRAMLKSGGDFFVLQVAGDSMIEEGILDGDFVIVRRRPTADNGQVVVALVDGGATLKKFYKRKTHIELHSANAKYPPLIIRPHQDFHIEGQYCGLIRY
jgi:repressor LexA